MKKPPDVFDKMVERDYDMNHVYDCDDVWRKATVMLLRRYHAKIRRLVKRERVSGETGTEGDIAYNQAIDDVLAALDAMAGKGRK